MEMMFLRVDQWGNPLTGPILKGTLGDDTGFGMAITPQNQFGIAGYSQALHDSLDAKGNSRDLAFWLLDDAGNLLNYRTFGDSLRDEAKDVIYNREGGFSCLGLTRSFRNHPGDVSNVFFLKLDRNGNPIPGAYSFFGEEPCYDFGRALLELPNGNIIATGMANPWDNIDGCQVGREKDAFLARLTPDGQLNWPGDPIKIFGQPFNDERGNNLILSKDGDIVLIGKNLGNWDPVDKEYLGSRTSFMIKISQEGIID